MGAIYNIFSKSVLTGASVKVFLLLALFIGMIAGKELAARQHQIIFLAFAWIIWFIGQISAETTFPLLAVYLCYEILTYFKPHVFRYILPLVIAIIPSDTDNSVQLIISAL